jgi:hypothetical protein
MRKGGEVIAFGQLKDALTEDIGKILNNLTAHNKSGASN